MNKPSHPNNPKEVEKSPEYVNILFKFGQSYDLFLKSTSEQEVKAAIFHKAQEKMQP